MRWGWLLLVGCTYEPGSRQLGEHCWDAEDCAGELICPQDVCQYAVGSREQGESCLRHVECVEPWLCYGEVCGEAAPTGPTDRCDGRILCNDGRCSPTCTACDPGCCTGQDGCQ